MAKCSYRRPFCSSVKSPIMRKAHFPACSLPLQTRFFFFPPVFYFSENSVCTIPGSGQCSLVQHPTLPRSQTSSPVPRGHSHQNKTSRPPRTGGCPRNSQQLRGWSSTYTTTQAGFPASGEARAALSTLPAVSPGFSRFIQYFRPCA